MKVYYGNTEISDYLLSYEKSVEFEKDTLIGNTPCAKITLEIDNIENVIPKIPTQAITIVYMGKEAHYMSYEFPEDVNREIKLVMYDNMIKLNQRYLTKMTYPCKVRDQIVEISKLADIEIIYNNLPTTLLDKEVNWYDNTVNMRLYIGWIAEAAGMNAYINDDGKLVFCELSPTPKHEISDDDIENYSVCNQISIGRVEYNNGLAMFEHGTSDNDTLYISSDNPYIDQKMVDHIFDLYSGLAFESAKDIKIVEISNLLLGDIFSYGDHNWIALSIETIYHGGTYGIQNISGEVSTKEFQALSQHIGDSTKIRMLTIEVNRNENRITLMAKEQEDINKAYAQFILETEIIRQEVATVNEKIYYIETGRGNIFDNCDQYVRKNDTETELKYIADMPLGIGMQELRNKDICISVDIKTIAAIPRTLSGRVGCKFSITYTDDTVEIFELWFVPGVYYLAIFRGKRTVDINKRIYRTYHIADKEIKYVSNLGIYADVNGEYISVGRPKVEFGTYPTGFEFDMQALRDSITTVEKSYTEIEQKTESLSLRAVSLEQEVTNVKGDVSAVDKRLQSAEIKLTPTEIVNAVNEKIGKDGAVITSSTTLDKNGFHIKGKGFDITNLKNVKVFEIDSNGNITLRDITAKNGNFEGVITNKSGTATAQLFQGALTFSDSRYGDMILGNNGISFSSSGRTNFALTNGANGNQTDIEIYEDTPMVFSWRSGSTKTNVMRVAKSVGLGVLVYGGTYFTVQNGQSFSGNVRAAAYGGLLMESASTISFYPYGGAAAGVSALSLDSDYATFNKNVYIDGGLTVTSINNKHKAMPTSHGYVGMEAVESPIPMFEDYGTGTTDDEGKVMIYFDPTWLEVTSTDHEYFVYLQECGDGKVWVSVRTDTHFVVSGTPNLEFMWNVKARQKGFEIERYKKVEMPEQSMAVMNAHEKAMSEINDRNAAKISAYESAYENILKERIGMS